MNSAFLYSLLIWSGWQVSKCDAQNWSQIDSRPLPVWYDQGKIGVLIVWGLFSVPGFRDDYFQEHLDDGTADRVKYMVDTFGPRYKYPDLAPRFKAEFFSAPYWADIFHKSGARFVVFNAKHCDGFALFPSNWSFNWNSVDVGPQIDFVGELSRAVRKKSLKFGIHYCINEYAHPMYQNDKKKSFSTNDYVTKKIIPELKQLVTAYSPSTISTWRDEQTAAHFKSIEFLSWLYNESPVRNEVVVDDRWGTDCRCKHGDSYSSKCGAKDHKWYKELKIDSVAYGYRKHMRYNDFLTMIQILKNIVETVADGGNILLNVAPSETGNIPPLSEERLLQLGEWMNINGEAIYKTSPWIYRRDTYNKKVWYTCVMKPQAKPPLSENFNDITALYAIFLEWPKNNALTLESLFACISCERMTVIHLLGNEDKNLQWTTENKMITINLPNFVEVKSKDAWTLRFKQPK